VRRSAFFPVITAVVVLLSPAACADPPARDPSDWTTYHYDNSRAGVAPGLAPPSALSRAWRASLDGAVYGQPLVIGDRVFAATENNTVYALDAATGRVRWSTHLGTPMRLSQLPCGNIDPLGITSTMVYDPATKRLFALAETTGGRHTLVSLDAATGKVGERRAAEPPKGNRIAHQQRGSLSLVGGRIYIPYGGLSGDCDRYFGSVVALPTTGSAKPLSYHIPTTREAGIWATGGGALVGDRLIYAVGNGESTTTYDGSDSVVALNRDLKLVDRFTPTTWAEDNSSDADLGSMTPAPVGGYVYANGKRGVGYTLRPDHLGGIGGQVDQAYVCPAFGSAAVSGNTVYVPCIDGPRAVTIDANGKISVGWQAVVSGGGSPVVGGGVVWVIDTALGALSTLDPATGVIRQRIPIGDMPRFASPTLSHNHAYIGTMTGVVAIAGG
jgi:polyvinyl alcohol dehydrogenase (cytochrome)